jgi:hypothetical protein
MAGGYGDLNSDQFYAVVNMKMNFSFRLINETWMVYRDALDGMEEEKNVRVSHQSRRGYTVK